jgi:hypothetical protein
MSTYSERGHLNPNDPTYYAPRWLRERSAFRLSPSSDPSYERPRGPVSSSPAFDGLLEEASSSTAFDGLLEEAVPEVLRRPLDPEVIHEPPGFVRELDRRTALINVAGRFAAAVGISALVALFFAVMVPASRDYARQPDGGASSFSAILQSIKTAFYQSPLGVDESKPALSEFQKVLASTRTSQDVTTHEQSEMLLQQFLQWRQKPDSTGAPQ